MGFMDKLSKVLGGDRPAPVDTVKGPSATLREHGIDPSNLKFAFNQDGTVTITGHAKDQSECDRICQVVEDIPNVKGVVNKIIAGTPEAAPESTAGVVVAETENADAGAEDQAVVEDSVSADRTYTVQAGDTLWAIAEKMYGSGGKYMKIFEANTALLENPDKIFPGQELVIPDLEKS